MLIPLEMPDHPFPYFSADVLEGLYENVTSVELICCTQAVEATVKAIKDSNTHLNPITESSVIKVPVPK